MDATANELAADLRQTHSSAVNRLGTAGVYFDGTGFTTTVDCGSTAADHCLVRPTAAGTQTTIEQLPDGVGIDVPNLTGQSLSATGVGGVRKTLDFAGSGSATARGVLNATAATCPAGTPTGFSTVVVADQNGDNNPQHCATINPATSRVEID